jgi:hypothetical protein
MANPRKPFYRLDEICVRWQMSESDIASYVVTGELTIAVVLAGLQLEYGTYEQRPGRSCVRIPLGARHHTGPIDLLPSDGWHVIEDGQRKVSCFQAEPNHYLEVAGERGSDTAVLVRRASLALNHAEVVRFEVANGVTPALDLIADDTTRRRGAPPQFDWDDFWVEVCHTVYVDGVPDTQGALVRRMDQWFAERVTKPPSASTLKRKLIPLWRRIGPEALVSAP